jgi:di/tricarboxylate transporter
MVVLVFLMTTQVVDLVLAVYTIAGLMVATRCISASSARKTIDWETVLTIGAAFGLGIALDKSGAALAIADRLVGVAGDAGPRAVLLTLYLLTSVFAAFVSSKASAVLMFPIALAAATALGVDARPMVMGVVFAAAATFATPLGYPTNLMVYGPGGYRFGDFARVGLPLNGILTVVVTVLVPIFWPF